MTSMYDADLSPYKGVIGNEYRVVKQTKRDDSIAFVIQVARHPDLKWSTLTERSTFELAMEAIDFLSGKMVVIEEVVYDSTQSKRH